LLCMMLASKTQENSEGRDGRAGSMLGIAGEVVGETVLEIEDVVVVEIEVEEDEAVERLGRVVELEEEDEVPGRVVELEEEDEVPCNGREEVVVEVIEANVEEVELEVVF